MLIRFTTSLISTTHAHSVGDVIEVPDAEALPLIGADFAEPVKQPEAIETATAPQVPLETAVIAPAPVRIRHRALPKRKAS